MRYFFDLFNAAHSEVLRAVEPANCQQLLGAGIGPYVELACLAGTERCGDKSFVLSAMTGIWLLGEWAQDDVLRAPIHELPKKFEEAVKLDWPQVRAALGERTSVFCLGSGPAYTISNEAALTFQETCQINAESYSSAEVLHGPVLIVDGGFPVIGLAALDEAEGPLAGVVDDLAAEGAAVFAATALAKKRLCAASRSNGPCVDGPNRFDRQFLRHGGENGRIARGQP